ncbi:MAG: hypothetical protein ACRDIC_06110 [bacterium]
MADEFVETRRVVIEYTIRIPDIPARPEADRAVVDRDLVEQVRRELIRTGSRNPDIFGGRA